MPDGHACINGDGGKQWNPRASSVAHREVEMTAKNLTDPSNTNANLHGLTHLGHVRIDLPPFEENTVVFLMNCNHQKFEHFLGLVLPFAIGQHAPNDLD